jgi:hypothetical protein
MKWVAALVVVLGSSAALADVNELATPAPGVLMEPYAPFKLVGVMPDTGQVLLWDENAMTYRLARSGEDLDGWRVSGLDLKDPRGPRIALQKEDLIDELELVRLPRPGSVIVFKDARDRTMVGAAAAPAPAPAPAIPPTVIAAPLETGVATPAPIGSPMIAPPRHARPAPLPVAAPAPAPAPAGAPMQAPLPPQLRPAPAPPPAVAPGAPPPQPAMYEHTVVIRRTDLDSQMNDFDSLMADVEVAPVDGGGFELARLEPDSWVASLRFQQGDVVRVLAGERVSTVEDAARVYAKLRNARAFTAEVDRGGARLILRFEVKDSR